MYYDADGKNISASITPSSARADEGQPFIPTDPPQLSSVSSIELLDLYHLLELALFQRRASSSGRSIPTAGQLELIIQSKPFIVPIPAVEPIEQWKRSGCW